MVSKIKKRDGNVVRFRTSKMVSAIEKAMLAMGGEDESLPKELATKVIEHLDNMIEEQEGYIPHVEDVQDIIEKVLMEEGHSKLAKTYILYRQKRAEIRKQKKDILGIVDDSKLSVNGLMIAKSRYLLTDSEGNVSETPKQMFHRVAREMAQVEKEYGRSEEEIKEIEEEFFEMIKSLEFVPSGRILSNAGTSQNMLYSSFVIPIADSMRGIFRALYDKALIQRLGGGTGFSFSRLRPKGASLTRASGYASGPVAFIKLFDHASELTIQSGNRRAANMGSLSVEHPDIIEFITMKERNEIKNFNISVEITDEFMESVKSNEKYSLRDPSTGKVIDKVDAGNIFQLIVTMAWKTGDPGVLFIDRINESNPLPVLGRIETSDPCGDQLLLPNEGGNLGALNLSKFVRYKRIQWKQIDYVTKRAVRFLDNTVDASRFPVKKFEKTINSTRRIGLGVMGFADMLYKLRVPYNSEKALEIGEKIMKFIHSSAVQASTDLADEKGSFPLWDKSIYKDKRKMRNCSLMAIAPTGSRSILVDTSAGIEPNFALGYRRKILGSTEILQVNPVLEEVLKEYELYSDDMMRDIIKKGDIKNIDVPEDLKEVFVTAHDITPQWHIRMQSVFQKHIDNAISKTINFSNKATIEDIKKAFVDAYDAGCKGLTVYRDGSLTDEVISFAR